MLVLSGTKDELQEDKETGKRKRAVTSDQKSKIAKTEGGKNANYLGDEQMQKVASNVESQLEAQTKELWALKDDLKNHVTTAELRAMLLANNQDSTGSESDLRDRW